MRNWFREQMAMYTAYHRDLRNCATHFIGVPLIVFALLVAMSLVQIGLFGGIPITLAALFLSLLLLLYCLAVPAMGIVSVVVYLPLLWYAQAMSLGSTTFVWVVIGACFVGGWILQLIGHVFEGRKPALTGNLLQVFMAPGFLVAEALFACGVLGELRADLEARSRKYAQTEATD
ncbi:MAG: DUF962 domain-containing protein [Alphaproteobacteria bacterium]|nr:DUF962 domain-containing protein [Alphaproteobacteria bacterium]